MLDGSIDVKSGQGLFPDVEAYSPVSVVFDASEYVIWTSAGRIGYIESASLGGGSETAVGIVGEAWVTGRHNHRVTVG